ncbi:LysR family transcriptional regulator [Cupriavidus pauculus]|uniref:LysR family transcriptional regulator n=1 Tax=Cupriavidus pauculus TaxID=82633 RepID=UPI001D0C656D|nr:LysR family transcriptional regulator [Cupriavidus pauculus]
MTLKQLEAFYWAATCVNFTAAAERVHLSVSSLSKRIAELEASLGVALFDRSGRSAELTAQGEQMLPQIHAMLHAAAELQQSAGQRHGLIGRCRIGLGELSGLTWLPKLVREVSTRHPGLLLEPHVDIGQALEQRLHDGELDIGVLAGPSTRSSLAAERIGQVDFAWVASQSLLELAGTDDPRILMGEQTLLTLPVGAGGTRVLDQWLARRGLMVGRRLMCNSWGAVVGMVVEGLGFGFVPTLWAEALVERGGLRILPDTDALEPLHYAVQWRRDDTRPLIHAMREIIRGVIDFQAPRCFV